MNAPTLQYKVIDKKDLNKDNNEEIYGEYKDGKLLIKVVIPWEEILILAAKACAEALGKSLGEKVGSGLGQAIVDAILGKEKDDDRNWNLIFGKLQEINNKLDEIIETLRTIDRRFDESRAKGNAENVWAAVKYCQVILGASGTPSTNEMSTLFDRSRFAWEEAIKAAQFSQFFYLPVLQALTLIISVYSLAAKKDKKNRQRHLDILKFLAKGLDEYVSKWCSQDNIYSFPNRLSDEIAEKARAEEWLTSAGSTKEHLVMWDFRSINVEIDPSEWAFHYLYITKFDRTAKAMEWKHYWGDDNVSTAKGLRPTNDMALINKKPINVLPSWLPSHSLPDGASITGYSPFFITDHGAFTDNLAHWSDRLGNVSRQCYATLDRTDKTIPALASAVDVTANMFDSLQKISSLNKNNFQKNDTAVSSEK